MKIRHNFSMWVLNEKLDIIEKKVEENSSLLEDHSQRLIRIENNTTLLGQISNLWNDIYEMFGSI